MPGIYSLPEYTWGGRAEHGSVQARLTNRGDRWLLELACEDWDDSAAQATRYTRAVELVADYFDAYTSGDLLCLLQTFYYNVDEAALCFALPFLKRGEPRVPLPNQDIFRPGNRQDWPRVGVLDIRKAEQAAGIHQ